MLSPSSLSQDQYDSLLSSYVAFVIEEMDTRTLETFAMERLEERLREACSLPEELCEEIASQYDGERLEELLSSLS